MFRSDPDFAVPRLKEKRRYAMVLNSVRHATDIERKQQGMRDGECATYTFTMH